MRPAGVPKKSLWAKRLRHASACPHVTTHTGVLTDVRVTACGLVWKNFRRTHRDILNIRFHGQLRPVPSNLPLATCWQAQLTLLHVRQTGSLFHTAQAKREQDAQTPSQQDLSGSDEAVLGASQKSSRLQMKPCCGKQWSTRFSKSRNPQQLASPLLSRVQNLTQLVKAWKAQSVPLAKVREEL